MTVDVIGVLAAQAGNDTAQRTVGEVIRNQVPSITVIPGWRLLVATALILIGVWLSKLLVRLLGRPVARRFRRQSVAQTVLRIIRLLTFGIAFLLAINVLGFRLGNIVLSVTVFSAVVGVILAPIVGNLISGLFILADQPYEIGDMIALDDGTRGYVDEITIRYTKIFTLDNTFLVLPNSSMRDRDVTNYSAEDKRTRLSLPMLVTYESDVGAARDLMEQAAAKTDGVIRGGPDIRIGSARYPAKPTCYLDEYADNGVALRLRYWVENPFKLLTIRSAVQTELWQRIEDSDADIEIAYPHQHHVFDDTSGQARVSVSYDGSQPPRRERPVEDGNPLGTETANPGAGEPADRPDEQPE
jgi:small-conductance mechanosensitive channel